MTQLDQEKIKKYKRGEFFGAVATVVCGAAFVYFVVCFSVSAAYGINALKLATLISAPVLMAISAGLAAFCNVKFGGGIEKEIDSYVRGVFIENAALMHPERDSLTFYFTFEDNSAVIRVNGYKEKIVFDFSCFGKLSTMRKATIGSSVEKRLCVTFIKLFTERNISFKSVGYVSENGRKKGRQVYIIQNGAPDKNAYKTYLKNR